MKSTNILKIELSNRRRKRRRRRIQNERERRNDEIMDKWGEEERIDRRQAKHLKRKKKYNKENK